MSETLLELTPNSEDLTRDEALSLGKAAIARKYGVDEGALPSEPSYETFLYFTTENQRIYRFDLGMYEVRVVSPSGEIEHCRWFVEPEDFTLPKGDLAPYPEMVEEFISSGAFDLLSPTDKADMAARIEKAGFSALLPESGYVAPQSTDISEQRAKALADEALAQCYGFTPTAMSFYKAQISIKLSDTREWKLVYKPVDIWFYDPEFDTHFGEYLVTLDAKTGKLRRCSWSLDGVNQQEYTKSTWGGAQAYTPEMLVWLREVLDAREAIFAKYPAGTVNSGDLSIEDDAAADQLLRDAGFDPRRSRYILPEAGDVTQEQALTLCKQALISERGLDETLLDACELNIDCVLAFPETGEPFRSWSVGFYGYGVDIYIVILNAETGELEEIYHDNSLMGNG